MPPLLQLKAVTKSFGAVRALRDVSFDLRPGEVHALLGENGAGKSTLIKIIAGAHPPDGGMMEAGGIPVRQFSPAAARRLGIACIYQQPALFPDLNVAENIALRLEPATGFRRVAWPERRRRAAQLLEQIGAHFPPGAEVRDLSMPEQQLLEIACALGAGARIVIMDEPTASLTQTEQLLLYAAVRKLRETGAGVIYISHRLEEIFALADRVTVLRDGESAGTHAVSEVDEAALIKLMVGHDIHDARSPHRRVRRPGLQDVVGRVPPRGAISDAVYISPLDSSAKGEFGKVVLSLNNLGCAASGVHDVKLDVRAGEIVGLAGLVGSGRTELARTIFGITPADAGAIFLDGERVSIRSPQEAVARGLAYLPEDRRRHGVILEMPIAANITLAIHRRIFPGAWLRFGAERAVALEFIRALGVLASGPDAPASSLSGGNQQKVALARWLAAKPRVLMLDEPTQGVDVAAKTEIHKIIRRLAKTWMAVLMISSDLGEVLDMSDRIAVMRGGTVVATLPGHSPGHEVMTWALGQQTVSA